MHMKTGFRLALIVGVAEAVVLTASGQTPSSTPPSLPAFIPTLRMYGAGDHDDFELSNIRELGFQYIQGHSSFLWGVIEPRDDGWKWGWTDEVMAKVVQYELKHVPGFILPKTVGLPWDSTIARDDPRFATEYEEFVYEVVNRYRTHPAWGGIVAVWGGSSDVWGEHPFQEPEVQVPLLNAAYDGIKRADSSTVVISFNMATTASSDSSWEDWHNRAFALSPRFDWFGVQSHNVLSTLLAGPDEYGGVLGLTNVRRFLDEHGYSDKPMFLNEGGFMFGEDIGGLPEQVHAEQSVETLVVSRTLNVNLTGWVYFLLFGDTHLPEDFGLMSALEQHDPPQPRQAWYALQTLIKTVRFFDFGFEAKLSGEYNAPSPPFVYRFAHRETPSSKLWVVFSPRAAKQEPISQTVTINIAPATQAFQTGMLGEQTIATPDSSGNIAVASTSAPFYLKADLATAVAKQPAGAPGFALLRAYPNPFNPATTVAYTLPVTAVVKLTVHDLLGRVVVTLVHERQAAGHHQVRFDANHLASGVYICQLQSAGRRVQRQKIAMLR